MIEEGDLTCFLRPLLSGVSYTEGLLLFFVDYFDNTLGRTGHPLYIKPSWNHSISHGPSVSSWDVDQHSHIKDFTFNGNIYRLKIFLSVKVCKIVAVRFPLG